MSEPRIEIEPPAEDVEMSGAGPAETPAAAELEKAEVPAEGPAEAPAKDAPAEEEEKEDEGPPSQANKFLE